MKKKILSLMLALGLCLGLAAPAFAEDLVPFSAGFNKNRHHGSNDVETGLYQEGEYFVRVERYGSELIVEYYDSSFELVSSKRVPFQNLGRWGGFFIGEHYNFVITGQANGKESDDYEVIRVIKFDKDWNQVGQAGLKGANTHTPFISGTLRCAEDNGILYVHTCHEMYKTRDGLNHQANMTFSVRQSDMVITDGRYDISNYRYGYVSHSFDQYILVDQEHNIVTLDDGDAAPRAAALIRYDQKAGRDTFTGECQMVKVCDYVEGTPMGDPGGLAETSSSYITAYRYKGVNDSAVEMYVSFTPKNNFTEEATKTIRLTTNNSIDSTSPTIAPTGLDGGYVLWADRSGDTLYYVTYTAEGKVSPVKTAKGYLPDYVPIACDGKLVWHITNYSVPTFYTLDASGVTATVATIRRGTGVRFSDVEKGSWCYEPVQWAVDKGITSGASATAFLPDQDCTTAQILTFLWKANGSPEPGIGNPFSNVNSNNYYYKPALWASEKGLVTGSSFSANTPCTRAAVVTYLWQLAGKPEEELGILFMDVPKQLEPAVAWATNRGITSGTRLLHFSPDQICTRGQIATFLYNAYGK